MCYLSHYYWPFLVCFAFLFTRTWFIVVCVSATTCELHELAAFLNIKTRLVQMPNERVCQVATFCNETPTRKDDTVCWDFLALCCFAETRFDAESFIRDSASHRRHIIRNELTVDCVKANWKPRTRGLFFYRIHQNLDEQTFVVREMGFVNLIKTNKLNSRFW